MSCGVSDSLVIESQLDLEWLDFVRFSEALGDLAWCRNSSEGCIAHFELHCNQLVGTYFYPSSFWIGVILDLLGWINVKHAGLVLIPGIKAAKIPAIWPFKMFNSFVSKILLLQNALNVISAFKEFIWIIDFKEKTNYDITYFIFFSLSTICDDFIDLKRKYYKKYIYIYMCLLWSMFYGLFRSFRSLLNKYILSSRIGSSDLSHLLQGWIQKKNEWIKNSQLC